MLAALGEFGRIYMSRVNAYEASTVVLDRQGPAALEKLERLFELLEIKLCGFYGGTTTARSERV